MSRRGIGGRAAAATTVLVCAAGGVTLVMLVVVAGSIDVATWQSSAAVCRISSPVCAWLVG